MAPVRLEQLPQNLQKYHLQNYPAIWVFFFLQPEREPWGELCYLTQEERVAEDHARQLTIAWSFAVRARLQHWPAPANLDYLVPVYVVFWLISSRLSSPVLFLSTWAAPRIHKNVKPCVLFRRHFISENTSHNQREDTY